MRRSVFLFCFILFYFFIHTFLVKFMKSLYPVIKHKMKQKERKKKGRRRKRRRKTHVQKKKKKKKNACGPATDLLGQNMCWFWVYERLSHLLKIHFLNIFDVMSSSIHIHIITFHDLYHADCIVLFLIASTIIQKHVYKIVWNSSVLYTFLSK